MTTTRIFAAALASLLFLVGSAQATLIGNDVTVGRASASDGATGVMSVLFNAPIPTAGTINGFAIFDQTGNNAVGYVFDALVLRPLGGGDYKVLANDALTPTGTNAEKLYSVAPVSVLAGDLIAQTGRGVPYTDGSGATYPDIYYPITGTPTAGTTIMLGSVAYPENSGFHRNYSLAASFVPVPEPASCVLFALGAVGLLVVARRRRKA